MTAYTQQTWNDGPGGATPITAARLNHEEAGIAAAEVAADIGTPGTASDTALRQGGQMLLLGMPTAQLSANFTSLANTSEQVIGNLLVALPIIARKCTITIEIQLYSTFGAGNTNVYGSIGAASTGLGNFHAANVYAGGVTSQSIWSNTGVVTNYDLSTQQYVSMTVTNDASTAISFSANAYRTSLLVEIFG